MAGGIGVFVFLHAFELFKQRAAALRVGTEKPAVPRMRPLKNLRQRRLAEAAQKAVVDPENDALVDLLGAEAGLVNLMLRNEQNIPRAQVVRRALHDVRHPPGQAENDLVKIVVVRLEVQVALVGGMKKAVFLVEVTARAYALHGAPPFTSQTSCRSQGSSSASSRRTSSAGTQPIAR